jgi:hypothetical protein
MIKISSLVFGVLVIFSTSIISSQAGSLQGSISAYEPEDCIPVVDEVVENLKIDRNLISDVQYLTDYVSMGEAGEEVNFQAWLSFATCKGNFAVNMTNVCQVLATFETGDCNLDLITQD